jgi:hypothetical protein
VAAEHWYIYYKLPVAHVDAIAAAVRDMQRRLESDGVIASLQMRVDVADGMATLMECYAGVADAATFGPRLEAAVAASDLPAGLRPARRVERFSAL